MARKSALVPLRIVIAALLSLAAGMRPPVAAPVQAKVAPRMDHVAAGTPSPGIGQPDHGIGNNIKHFRQGPFNEGERPMDIYCLLIQSAFNRSLEDSVKASNVETTASVGGIVTLGPMKLASVGDIGCRAAYRVPDPEKEDKDPYVEIEFGTKGLDIASAPITAGKPSSKQSKQWISWPSMSMSIDLGFTMDLDVALKINTVNNKVEVTRSQVSNFETRSTSEESKASSVVALCAKWGTQAKKYLDFVTPACVTEGITGVFSRVGNYMLTSLVDPASSCLIVKLATKPLGTTKLNFRSIDPINIQGNLVKFSVEDVSISPDFVCKKLSFNGHRLIVDLRDVAVAVTLFVDKLVPVNPEDGDVTHKADLESMISTKTTIHFEQSINVDVDILEPKKLSITPSGLALRIQIASSTDKQGIISNSVTRSWSASTLEQLGQALYPYATIELEKRLKNALMKDLPLIEQHDGAASALKALTGDSSASGSGDVWKQVSHLALAAPKFLCNNKGLCLKIVSHLLAPQGAQQMWLPSEYPIGPS